MDWPLFGIAVATWVFWSAHFLVRTQVAQLAQALERPFSRGQLVGSHVVSGIAMFNLIAFFVVYGISRDWAHAAIIVLGGYAGAAVTFFALRWSGALGPLLGPIHLLGWLALPALTIAIWLVAF